MHIQKKRLFDIITAVIGLLLLFPVLALIGLLVKLEDGGAIFFKQVRVGKLGRKFTLYKIRTMKEVESSEADQFNPGNILRITAIGKFLRKTKIDELPQLINVLKGEMSLVGPRPEVEKWVAVYPEKWKLVHTVTPGITDIASIEFRNEEFLLATSEDPERTYRDIILPRKLELCSEYVMNQSFFGDIKLLFKTLICIFQ